MKQRLLTGVFAVLAFLAGYWVALGHQAGALLLLLPVVLLFGFLQKPADESLHLWLVVRRVRFMRWTVRVMETDFMTYFTPYFIAVSLVSWLVMNFSVMQSLLYGGAVGALIYILRKFFPESSRL